MKKLLFAALMAGTLMACHQNQKKADVNYTTDGSDIKYEASTYDFGKIKEGDKVSHSFKFTNTGKSPLIITSAIASCGCTTPVWPKTPIMPGDTGSISVTFNSRGKSGLQDKLITVSANTQPAQSIVHLLGEVLTPNK